MGYILLGIITIFVFAGVLCLVLETRKSFSEPKRTTGKDVDKYRQIALENKARLEKYRKQKQEEILRKNKSHCDSFIEEVLLPDIKEASLRGKFDVSISRGSSTNTIPPYPEEKLPYSEWKDILEHCNDNDSLRTYIEEQMRDKGFSCRYVGYAGCGFTQNGFEIGWRQ